MADLNPIAKRIHNLTPKPVRLTLDDGTEAVFQMSWTEFFQQEFQAEATRTDDDADYRLVSSQDNESILIGRSSADDDGWSMIGSIVDAEAAEPAEDD
jgi:hypothetical protein